MNFDMHDRSWWEALQVDWPEGQSGSWRLDRFTVTKEDAERYNLRVMAKAAEILHPDMAEGRGIVPGTYTRLMKIVDSEAVTFMSDTPAEIADHLPFLFQANESALVTGLGLGVVVIGLLDGKLTNPLERVTVLESDPHVISLVGPSLETRFPGKVEIICANAFTWIPPEGSRWHCAWHDIWPLISEENLPEIERLKEIYKPFINGFQMAWAEEQCWMMKKNADDWEQRIKDMGKWEEYQKWRKEQGFD